MGSSDFNQQGGILNRTQLQLVAEERARDAGVLLAAGQWAGAYYLAGYAAECGLKACIAKLTKEHDFPNKERAQKAYTHQIEVLVDAAGLMDQRKADAATNPTLAANWATVKDWDEKSRYELWTEIHARKLFTAITDATNGVLPWIRNYW